MELSKLNISSIAKDEIRRRFFHSRSAKNKTSNESDTTGSLDQKPDENLETSEEEKPPKVEQEVQQTVLPPLDGETSAGENDGFPLITSVFSLASSSSGTEGGGCASTDGISVSSDGKVNTTAMPQSVTYTSVHSSNDAPVSHQGSLPFVVKCSPSGVITVCSPPHSSSSTRQDNVDCTTVTSSLKGSVCSTEFSDKIPTSKRQQMFKSTSAGSLPTSASGSNASIVTFIDATHEIVIPVEKLRPEVIEGLSGGTSRRLTKDNTICSTSINQIQAQDPISCPQTTVSQFRNVQIPQQTNEVRLRQTVDTSLATASVTKTPAIVVPTNVNVTDSTNEGDFNLNESNKTDENPTIESLSNRAWENNGENNESSTPANTDNVQHELNDCKTNETQTRELCIDKEDIGQPGPTKQDEKIRQLKDLLRQKEAELEKFRFKGKTGSVSPAAQLRANFLKKNPSLCQRSRKLNASERNKSNHEILSAISINEDMRSDTSNLMDLTCKKNISSKTESCTKTESCGPDKKLSEKARTDVKLSSMPSKQKSTKFTNQDKYKLVNVTILQGHTRTLAVPLANENSKTISPTNDIGIKQGPNSKATETTTRKRKQLTPKKVGPDRSKRKCNSEEDAASLKIPCQITETDKPVKLGTDSADSGKTHLSKNTGLTVPITRTSPRRKQGNPSLKTTPLKRKSPGTNELKTQIGPSAPKKVPKIISAPKTITKMIGPPSKSASSVKSLTTSRSGQTPTVSSRKSKTGATITKGNSCFINMGTRPIATTTNTATLQPSATVTSSTSTTSKNMTFNLNDLSRATVANSLKHVLEGNMQNKVFALFGKMSGRDDINADKGDSKMNNSPVTGLSVGAKVTPQSNIALITYQATQGSKSVNPTSGATNTPDNGTCATKVPPATSKVPTSKVPIPMLTTSFMNAQQNNIRNELSKLGLATHITTTSNVPNRPKVVIPVNFGSLNCQPVTTMTNQLIQPLNVSCCQKGQSLQANTVIASRQLPIPLANSKSTTVSVPVNLTTTNTLPNLSIPITLGVANSQMTNVVTGLATTVCVPILSTSTNNGIKNTSTESPSFVNSLPPSNNPNQVSAVTVTNRQAGGNKHPGSSLPNLIAVVNTIASPVTSKPTSIITRPLASCTVSVSVAKTSPIKEKANTNPTSKLPLGRVRTAPKYTSPRPLAPKPITPSNTSLQFLALKPTIPQSMSPQTLVHKPTTSQNTSPQSFVPKPITPHNTSLKLLAPKSTSPQLLAPKSTSPQSISTKLTGSDPINQVIYTLPKPVMALPTATSTAFPENLSNGKILVYDVVQSNVPAGGQNPPVAGNDAAKLVVYLSNTGETRNLGIIKDNKIYLNTNQVAAATNQPDVKSPVTPPSASPFAEFIPNPGDGDFKVLLGLEHVVRLMM